MMMKFEQILEKVSAGNQIQVTGLASQFHSHYTMYISDDTNDKSEIKNNNVLTYITNIYIHVND